MKMNEVWHYVTSDGRNVFEEWVEGLADKTAQAKVVVRVARLAAGNFGDCKPLHSGVCELRIDWGPGYRVYYARAEASVVLLRRR